MQEHHQPPRDPAGEVGAVVVFDDGQGKIDTGADPRTGDEGPVLDEQGVWFHHDVRVVPVLGLPPYWYKDPVFRARAAREPRTVLTELGVPLDDETEVRVWDASGHSRWFVVPARPAGTEGWTEEQLAGLVTTESMIGVAIVPPPPIEAGTAR